MEPTLLTPDDVAFDRHCRPRRFLRVWAFLGHARIEDRIRCAKDTGLRNLPFGDFANNACWVEVICVAQDLMAFTQGLVLEGDMASAEPKRVRYALFQTAGRISTTSRKTTLRLQRE